MGVNQFQYGDDVQGYVKLESTFGTAVKPVGTDAFRALDMSMGQESDPQDALDHGKTRSFMESVQGRTPVQPWSATVILRPSGSLGVAPDFGELLKLAFGTETVVGSTSVAYTLLQDMTGLYASIYKGLTTSQEGVYSAIVQTLSIDWAGDGFITFTFSGVGANFLQAHREQANGAGSGATALVVDDADFFTKYGVIQNITGSDDNSSAGYQVTAIDHTTQTLTLDSAASWSDDDNWGAFLPTGSFAGDPLYGTIGQFSLDGDSTTVKNVSGNITINTGLDILNREAGTTEGADVIMTGRREVTGNISMLVKETEGYIQSHARRKVAQDMVVTLGDTAAKRIAFTMSNCELRPAAQTTPDTGPTEISLGFKAYGTSTGENEISVLMN